MANPLQTFKSDHHVILGLLLMAVGTFGAYGSVTGRLASMIAAFADPIQLVSGSTGTGAPYSPSNPQTITVGGQVIAKA